MAIATINPATGEVVKTFEPLTAAQIEQNIAIGGVRVPKTSADFIRGTRKQDDARCRDFGKGKRRLRPFDDARNGQAPEGRSGRGAEVRHRMPLLCGKCREIPGRRNCGDWSKAQFHPLFADWSHPGHHAVELSLLAGVSFCRAGTDGGQCRTAEARFERSAVRAEDRGHSSPRRFCRRRVPDAADRLGAGRWHPEAIPVSSPRL